MIGLLRLTKPEAIITSESRYGQTFQGIFPQSSSNSLTLCITLSTCTLARAILAHWTDSDLLYFLLR